MSFFMAHYLLSPSLPPPPYTHSLLASGMVPSPFDSFLANRGLKTLHIRMREHQKNAMAVAKFLEASPYVTRVIYPGLPSHPEHELVKRQCKGFGGMLTFIIKGTMDNAIKFFQAIKVCICQCVHACVRTSVCLLIHNYINI